MALKTAGSGYTLKFIGRHSSGELFAQTYSDAFTVTTGSAYKLDFDQYVGTAFGGEVFAPNPIVALTDRGGNILTNQKSGFVEAVLTTSLLGSQLLPAKRHIASFSKGLATFSGLYINEAGYPYQITFNTSLVSSFIKCWASLIVL